MSEVTGRVPPERCRCDAHEVLNRSGALFPGDGKVHTWLICQPISGRVPSPLRVHFAVATAGLWGPRCAPDVQWRVPLASVERQVTCPDCMSPPARTPSP